MVDDHVIEHPLTISLKAAAKLAGIGESTLHEWVRNGFVPGVFIAPGGRRRIRRQQFVDWLSNDPETRGEETA